MIIRRPREIATAALALGGLLVGGLAVSIHVGARLLARLQDLQPRIIELTPSAPLPLAVQPAAAAALADLSQPLIGGGQLQVLGNPALLRYPGCHQAYARNPWDLAAFDGRLYLGLGDASNRGPSPNAGPVPLISFDPVSGQFRQETSLPEEQIDCFYRHDDALWVPGNDPRQSWRWGNLYRLDIEGAWRQYRTLPRTIHAYALAWQGRHMLAGISIAEAVPKGVGSERHGSALAVSSDQGRSWSLIPLGGWRIFDFLHAEDQLFATDIFPGPAIQRWLDTEQRQDWHAPVYEIAMTATEGLPNVRRRRDLDAQAIFPDTPHAGERAAVVTRAISWGQRAAYLGLFARWEDRWPTQGAYLADRLREGDVEVRRIPLPAGALAFDLRLEGPALQVLFAEPEADDRWRSSLWESRDGQAWKPKLSFSTNAPARAVERLGDDLYLSLGNLSPPEDGRCNAADRAAGTLLRWRPDRYKISHFHQPPDTPP